MQQEFNLFSFIFCHLLKWHMPKWSASWFFEKEEHAVCLLCGMIISRPRERMPFSWWHFQRLGKDKGQSLLRYGRAWWHLFRDNLTLHAEWEFFGRSSTGANFLFAAEEKDFQIHVAIKHLFSIWLTIEYFTPLRKLFKEIYGGFGYETGFGFYDEAIWVRVAYNEMGGARQALRWLPNWLSVWSADRSSSSRWLRGFGFYFSFHYLDMLLGRRNYSAVEIGKPVEMDIVIHPDTTILGHKYKALVQMKECTWKRARWPFPERLHRAEIECVPPIPIPGKGESSWDLEDDATHSMTCVADTPEQAVEKLVASVLERRQKYGLPDSISEEQGGAERVTNVGS